MYWPFCCAQAGLPPKIKIQIKIARPNLIRKTPSSCGASTAQMWEAFNDFLHGGSSCLRTTYVVLAALELSRPRGPCLPARRLFHRVISCIHAGRERPLKSIDPLLVFT